MRGAVERKKVQELQEEQTSRNARGHDISSKPKLPEEEVGNLKKRWNTYPGTWAITAEHRWMGGERTEELSVSHESEKEIMSRRMAQVLPGPTPPPQDPGGRR